MTNRDQQHQRPKAPETNSARVPSNNTTLHYNRAPLKNKTNHSSATNYRIQTHTSQAHDKTQHNNNNNNNNNNNSNSNSKSNNNNTSQSDRTLRLRLRGSIACSHFSVACLVCHFRSSPHRHRIMRSLLAAPQKPPPKKHSPKGP